MANKYANLVAGNKIKDEYGKINVGFDKVEADVNSVNNNINGVANNLNQSIEAIANDVQEFNDRVDNIITTPAEGISEQEIIDARDGEISLGAKIRNVDEQLGETSQELGNKVSLTSFREIELDLIRKASIYNQDKLKNWHLKRAKQLKGENIILNVALWSDSIGDGYYATFPMTLDGKRNKSYAGLLHNHFKQTVGDVGVGWVQGYPTNDVLMKWRQTGSWTITDQGVGRGSMRSTVVDSTAELDFDGSGITVVFSNKSFAATCDIYVDGVFNQTYNTNLASGTPSTAGVVTIEGLNDGTHTLKIVQTKNGSYLDIVGAFPIKGKRGVRVLNHSFSGNTTSRLSSNTEATITMLPADLIVFGYHTNDAANVSPQTYRDRLGNYVDIALAAEMDVILLAQSAKSNMSTYTSTIAYRDIMREVAGEKGVCMVDWTNRWRIGNELPNLASHLYDLDHPNEAGHRDLFELLLYALEG